MRNARFLSALFVVALALPSTAATWTPRGPSGGTVLALTSDPSAPSVLYAGTFLGGLYKSTDGGESWRFTGLANEWVTAIAVDPREPSVVYAGTMNALYRSRDGGATWVTVDNVRVPYIPGGDQPAAVYAAQTYEVVFDPKSPSLVYLGTVNDVFISTDHGESFTATQAPFYLIFALAVSPESPNILLSGTFGQYGIHRSEDGGKTWQLVKPTSTSINAIVFDAGDANVAWAATDNGLFRSADTGRTWTLVASFDRFQSIAVDPRDPHAVYVGARFEVDRITDEGRTVERLPGPDLFYIEGVHFTSAGRLIIATDDGVFQRVDGSLTRRDRNLNATSVLQIEQSTLTPGLLFVGRLDGVPMRSRDHGATWERLPAPEDLAGASLIALDPRDDALYAPTINLLYRSRDHGETWMALHPASDYRRTKTLMINPVEQAIYLAEGEFFDEDTRLFRSIDHGEHWELIGRMAFDVRCLVASPQNPFFLFAGTTSGVYRSTDGGRSWTASSTGFPTGGEPPFLEAIAIDPTNPSVMYAACSVGPSAGVFKSYDGGVTWSSLGLRGERVFSLAVIPGSHMVLAGTDRGIFATFDGGTNWVQEELLQAGSTSVRSIVLSPGENRIRATTIAGGVLERPIAMRRRGVRTP